LALLLTPACSDGDDGDGSGDSDSDSDTDTDSDSDTDTDTDTDTDSDTDTDTDTDSDTDTPTDTGWDTSWDDECELDGYGELIPPHLESSGGSGGLNYPSGTVLTTGTVEYRLIVPSSYTGDPTELLIVYSGTEGGALMMANMLEVDTYCGVDDMIIAVLDGVDYYGDGQAGADVLDQVRLDYNIDNDRTYLLSESAGTGAGLELGLQLRQSYFAAYWANDVNDQDVPSQTAEQLGFRPWGNAGPGGDWPDANAIVDAMIISCYRVPWDAPYSGPGSDDHGSTEQFLEAVSFFPGKER
jgi:hypothetical protein